MALDVLKKLRAWKRGGPVLDLVEMGAIQEGEKSIPVEPGQPVPFEASLWAPPRWNGGDSTPLYQRGSADIEPRPGAKDPFKPRTRKKEKVRTVKKPKGARKPKRSRPIGYRDAQGAIWLESTLDDGTPVTMGMDHECLNCGHMFRVPRRRPIEIACPDCGTKDLLR
jgi:DNA-directed RNA polymerase subunit RPC12/RpoP